MPTLTINNRFRLLAALSLLAVLLAITPASAQAAGAVRCDAESAGIIRVLRAQNSAPNKAGLVIDFGDGRVLTYCIDLGDDGQATGEELLRASNLPVIFEYSGGIGGAVCRIDTVGSDFPAEPCFSHCTLQPGEKCMYWSYSQLVGDHWQFSQVGASSTIVHSGDVNGWAWGESTVARGAQPPLRTLAEICLPATATPTPTSTATNSPTPTPIATPTATLPPAQPAPPPATTTPYVAQIITATPTVSRTPTSTPAVSPVVAAAAPTQSSAPTALPASSPTAPAPPAPPPSATLAPPTASAVSANVSATPLPLSTPANRSAGGSLRIQLPLIQHAAAVIPSATASLPTARPIARVESAAITPPSVTPAPVMASPARPAAPADDPTRTYPYFGGTAAFLLAGWVLLRRGRTRSAQ